MLDDKAFEDKAWLNMSQLLDEELPEKKATLWWKRYTIFFILFLFISGLGMGSYMYFLSDDSDDINAIINSIQLTPINSSEKDSQYLIAEADSENASTENSHITPVNTASPTKNISSAVSYNIVNQDSPTYQLKTTPNQQIAQDNNLGLNELISNENKKSNTDISSSIMKSSKVDDIKQETIQLAVITTGAPSINSITPISTESLTLENRISPINSLQNKRRVNTMVFAQANFYPELDASSIELGIKSMIGAVSSPWSFGMGISYEYINFSSNNLYSHLNSLSDNNKETFEANVPINSGDSYTENIDLLVNIHQINFPLSFHYRINKLNLGVGLHNSIITRVKGKDLDELSFGNTINTYRAGISQYFDFSITPKLHLGISGTWDITGLEHTSSNNSSFNMHRFALNLGYKF